VEGLGVDRREMGLQEIEWGTWTGLILPRIRASGGIFLQW
jgi:hypothetical protein